MTFSRIVTRFAPSPTGKLHIGGARTALFNWLFARANSGKFLLRIEDTDRERSSEEATAQILASLKWLNLDWDNAPISQFSRQTIHHKKAQELLQSGGAYKCFATPDEISNIKAELKAKGSTTLFISPWREVPEEQHPDLPYTIRLKTPETGKSIIKDKVFGEISIDNDTIDDLIILRSDGSPTYNFAVVVDDHDMEVSHIIRGDDHIANTFKQKLIYEAFGWDLPVFAHVPLILNEQGKKLSKREGSTGTELYQEEGYLPEVVFNFLARLGWSHGTDEIFSAAEAIKRFKLEDLRKSPSRLDNGILKHLSGQYIANLKPEELYQSLLVFIRQNNFGKIPDNKVELVKKALPLIQIRSKTFQEVWEGLEFVLCETVRYDEKSQKILVSTPKKQLETFLNGLADLSWERDVLEDYAKAFGTRYELGLGKVLQPVRAALVGKTVSPSVFDIMIVLGKVESQNRLVSATTIGEINSISPNKINKTLGLKKDEIMDKSPPISDSHKGNLTEEAFNFTLKDALVSTSAIWKENNDFILTERTRVFTGKGNEGKHADILIADPKSPPIIIECSFDKNDAENDAQNRLGLIIKKGHKIIQAAISVYIPDHYRTKTRDEVFKSLVSGEKINYALYQMIGDKQRRWPTAGFIVGEVENLRDLILSSSLPKEEIERVADEVAHLIEEATDILEGLPEATKLEISHRISQRSFLKGLRTTMVLWLNSLLTQQRLHGQNVPNIPCLDFAQTKPINHLELIGVWKNIQKENWRSIFDPAITILSLSGNSDPLLTGKALQKLVEGVYKIEMAGLGLHINVGAELFPILSEDRKQAAAFYTQGATAELLAALTIQPEDISYDEWGKNPFSTRIIADLACGTGTLLRAGYRRVLAIHETHGGTKDSVLELHRSAMVKGLSGTDVSPIAAHLTSASLAAIGQGEPYHKTQIGWVKVGEEQGLTGSLEFLGQPSLRDLFSSEVAGRSFGTEDDSEKAIDIADESVDWVLMNPPYSRTRRGQSAFDIAGLTESERKSCQKRWGKLIRNEPVDKRAGMGASFLALGRKKVKKGGRIGFVLPLTAAFADTWEKTRMMVEQEFDDITALVVSPGKALGKDALSADTDMEEMLLIGTRRDMQATGLKKQFPVTCVTLNSPVVRLGEAGEIARAITLAKNRLKFPEVCYSPIRIGDTEIGGISVFDSGGTGEPWGLLGVEHFEFAATAMNLKKGILSFQDTFFELPIRMTSIEQLFEVGPTHHLIGHIHGGDKIGAFELFPLNGPNDSLGSDRALWSADSKVQDSLIVLPTHKGVPICGRNVEDMRRQQGTLFYSRNMRWTSQGLLSAITENKAMGGSSWTSLKHPDSRIEKTYCLWTNSILGMIIHWTIGQRTQTGRSRTQINALKKIPCPDFNLLGEKELNFADIKFAEISQQKLLPACQAHADAVRKEIDSVIGEIFHFTPEVQKAMKQLRTLWCNEPSVHGMNKKAQSLL